MLLTMLERAKLALSASSDKDFAHKLGINASTVVGYKQRGVVPLEQCIKIAEQTGVSLDWLILGKGESDKNTAAGKATPSVVLVPLYDVPVSAGHGSFFDSENIIQQIPFDAEWLKREDLIAGRLACLPIEGDSMSPGLKTSDIVLIDLTHQRGDGVFVLRLNGALRIKRLQWLADGRLRISSDNPIYEPEYVDPNTPPDDFAIIGFCHTKIGRVA
ncbi:LexA family transcriptional regulator [Eikenella corrodens]|uniref:LexA family transcriptional regulator n=1 Tax=Eikenella corrodens TaxID=539 RepID=UPI001EFAC375|nr:S24 family peptidase [Eikenella corrodens]